MSGIAGSLIAATIYSAGRKIGQKFNDPCANAIDDTINYFEEEKGIVIIRENLAAMLEDGIGKQEISKFKAGEELIDIDRLALKFAVFEDLYLPDDSEKLEICSEMFAYFNRALMSELLKDEETWRETLWNMQNIHHKRSEAGQEKILESINKLAEKLSKAEIPESKALWPAVSLPLGGPKISEPFAGRKEELESLTAAMGADRTVVAVVGMAGQGKSCLVGEWYKQGARPAEGVGLIWRKVYEAGYTFDRFVDELFLYLTGERIDRQALTTIEGRTQVVEAILHDKPCWIVLDGVERWLNRWVADPDAGIEGLTADDRAAQDPVLDKFLKGASFWDNGSLLLLTTRAVPSALDENPPVRVGRKTRPDELLTGLKLADAARLLTDLGVKGSSTVKRHAAKAYGNHPYAVHVLGALIRDLYGGDVSRWEQVNPLREAKLEGLFERIIEHRGEDLELLELIACSVGPALVRMLAERLGQDEIEIRKKLADLAKWQMVEFDKDEAVQHTVVRKFLTERMGAEIERETQKAIAAWWAEQKISPKPERLEQIRPLLRAIEHLLAAGDPDAATDILLTKPFPERNYTMEEWLWRFGYLDEDIRICGEAMGVYGETVNKDARHELPIDLAKCHNNRGTAFVTQGELPDAIADFIRAIEITEQLVKKESSSELLDELVKYYNNRGCAYNDQGKHSEAVADYDCAIEITEQLLEKEGRRELRSDLMACYNNRGSALATQGKFSEAITDFSLAIKICENLFEKEGHCDQLAMFCNNRGNTFRRQGRLSEAITDLGLAIKIYEQLVEKEGHRELRKNLSMCLFNRATAWTRKKEWAGAGADIDKDGGLLRELIEEGQGHVIGSFIQTAGLRCAYAKKLGDIEKTAQWANEAMRWFVEEVQAGRGNEMLLKAAVQFAGLIEGNLKVLLKNGLDEGLWDNFNETLERIQDQSE